MLPSRLVRPRLLPLHLDDEPTAAFHEQLGHLQRLLAPLVDWVPPVRVGDPVPPEATAVVVPDMNVLAYDRADALAGVDVPILVITSEFGTVSMWDWEIRDYLRRAGIATIAPTSLQEAHDVCRALAVRATLAQASMVTYMDDLGGGMQPDIFKRFYWYDQECTERMQDQFGVTIERRSFRDLAARARDVPDSRVDQAARRFADTPSLSGLPGPAVASALRLYVALDDELDETDGIVAAGINCLNESATSDTTPCLAWNLLYEDRGLMWGCEADLPSMMTEFVVHKSLGAPVMMTNLYPFLMGDAALAHERIPHFPQVDQPEHHVLVAHCGYLGVVPQSFATQWAVRPPVLEIVDPNAHALDARLPEGPTTVVKLAGSMDVLTVSPATLTGYVQYQDSDCLNGAVLRVQDGPRFVEGLASHHAILATGDLGRRLDLVAAATGLRTQRI